MEISGKLTNDFRLSLEQVWLKIHERHKYDNLYRFNQSILKQPILFYAYFNEVDLYRLDRFKPSSLGDQCNMSSKIQRQTDGSILSVKKNLDIFQKIYRVSTWFSFVYLIIMVTFSYRYDWVWHEYKYYLNYSNKLIESKQQQNQSSSSVTNVTQKLEHLRILVDENKHKIEIIGNPLINLNFLDESTLIYILFLNLTIYHLPYWVNYLKTIDFSIMRFLLSPMLYLEHYSKLVIIEMNDFIESSRNFVKISLNVATPNSNLIYQDNSIQRFNDILSVQETKFLKSSNPLKVILKHNQTVENMKRMVLRGLLIPLNLNYRTTRNVLIYTNLFNLCLVTLSVSFVFYYFIIMASFREISLEPMDLFAGLNVLNLVFLAHTSIGFHLPTVASNSISYIVYIIDLIDTIKVCIRNNRIQFSSMLPSQEEESVDDNSNQQHHHHHSLITLKNSRKDESQSANHLRSRRASSTPSISIERKKFMETHKMPLKLDENFVNEINKQLLYIYIQYRLLVRQLKNNNHSMNFFAFCASSTIGMAAITIAIQAPYIEADLIVIGMSAFLFFILLGDCSLAPICYKHAKSIELVRCIFSLLANIVEIQVVLSQLQFNSGILRPRAKVNAERGDSHSDAIIENNIRKTIDERGSRSGGNMKGVGNGNQAFISGELDEIFDMHIVRLFWKEVSNADILTNKFATMSFGVAFTYPNFIRFHVFSGFLIVYSTLNNMYSRHEKASFTSSFNFLFI